MDLHLPLVVHLDGFHDNPRGDFSIERSVLEPHGVEFCAAKDASSGRAADATVVLFRAAAVDRSRIAALSRCRVLIRYGIGLDRVDVGAATERGIRVCNIPDFCTPEMASHTLALSLALHRKLSVYQGIARRGSWSLTREHPIVSAEETVFGAVGFGRIAREVLLRARALGYRCAATDPFVPAEQIARTGTTALSPSELLGTADIVSLHCPLTDGTRHLINESSIHGMKQTAILINTARGGLVDTEALTRALLDQRIGGAGLDVTDPEPIPTSHPLLSMANVIVTPHMAWYSEQAEVRLRTHAAEEALRAIHGKPLHYCVNGTP